MAVGKVARNSKKQFFGGGKGGLIRFGPGVPKAPKKKSKPEDPNSQSPDMTEYHKQLDQEIREQFGAEPEEETDKSDPSTGPESRDSTE